MPFIRINSSIDVEAQLKVELLKDVSQSVSATMGKPERYVMVAFCNDAIIMAGSDAPAAFVDVRAIGGVGGDVNRKLSSALCKIIHQRLNISPERIFLNFTDIPGADWGWNNDTF